MSIDVPLPPSPVKENFTINPPNDLPVYFLRQGHNAGMIVILVDKGENYYAIVKEKNMKWEDALWTAVYFCREAGIPGVNKEMIRMGDKWFRLGALYRYAGFEMTERESDYIEHGERTIGDYRSEHYKDEVLLNLFTEEDDYENEEVEDYL